AVFFFSSRRRHTSSSRDWSSDVCSSDLEVEFLRPAGGYRSAGYRLAPGDGVDQRALANVRTAGEGDLRKVAIGQEVERRGREQRSEERRVGKEGRTRRPRWASTKRQSRP